VLRWRGLNLAAEKERQARSDDCECNGCHNSTRRLGFVDHVPYLAYYTRPRSPAANCQSSGSRDRMNQTSPTAPASTAPITISTIENISSSSVGTVNQIEFATLLAILDSSRFLPLIWLPPARWPQEVRW
jgi:hypothetical protein